MFHLKAILFPDLAKEMGKQAIFNL